MHENRLNLNYIGFYIMKVNGFRLVKYRIVCYESEWIQITEIWDLSE